MQDGEREQLEQKANAWATANQTYYVDTRLITDITPLQEVIGVTDMKTYHIVPLATAPGRIDFGYTAATDRSRFALFAQKYPKITCNFYVVSEPGYAELLAKLDVQSLAIRTDDNFASFKKQLQALNKDDTFRLIAQLAYQMNASDIHFEPKATEARLRFRIDGTLHPIISITPEKYKLILTAVQNASSMKWGSDQPQAGRTTLELVGENKTTKPVNIRLETIPTMHGEELVARLLNLDITFLNLDNAQLSKPQRAAVDEIIRRPYGMVLTVGPTGSGKTSMLYSIINAANSPEVKIVTLEDPIEYDLPDTSQISVHSNDNDLFSAKLRAVVRQDPNIIMIGEIRDLDTAKTALQAALTGHLVLSTFHASSAAAAVNRLMDMIGQNPPNLSYPPDNGSTPRAPRLP
jgi:type II secretory ATPase GspE/PulE/Tfp pilus assembly ATPase PilB-like protein